MFYNYDSKLINFWKLPPSSSDLQILLLLYEVLDELDSQINYFL